MPVLPICIAVKDMFGYVMLPLDCIWLSRGCRNGVMWGFMIGTSLKIVLVVKCGRRDGWVL